MFRSCNNSGFQMKFSNGYIVSCQFSTVHYCSRESFGGEIGAELRERTIDSLDCEIAIIDKSGHFATGKIIYQMGLNIPNDEMVAGYVNADDVAKIIAYVSGLEKG